jgi:hypothetical protein
VMLMASSLPFSLGAPSATLSYPAIAASPSLQLLSPNGGEFWQRGSTQLITWTSSGLTGEVKIEISRYRGQYWEPIIESTPNNGSFSWITAGMLSSGCQIRISSTTDSTITDTSDASFDIWDFNQWESLAEGLDEGDFSCISISPYDSNLLFAGKLNNGGAYRSTTGGALWIPITQGLETEQIFAFAFAPSGSPTISGNHSTREQRGFVETSFSAATHMLSSLPMDQWY